MKEHIRGLDSVRAFAVLLVVVSHYGIGYGWIKGGLGVQVFFVLSGFLITTLLLKEQERTGRIDIGGFYRRRAARILPAFFAYAAAVVLYSMLRGRDVPWADVAAASFYVMNYFEGITAQDSTLLSHCWSLSVEEQFYLAWPFAFVYFFRRRALGWFLVCSIVAVWVIRIVQHSVLGLSDAYLYRAFEARADHLLVGCLLAVVAQDERVWKIAERCARTIVIPIALVALLFALSYLDADRDFRYAIAFAAIPLVVAALLPQVIVLASSGGALAAAINWTPLVYVGKISYGIYLFHVLPQSPVKTLTAGWSPYLGLLLELALVIGIASVSYRFWEAPMRTWLTSTRLHAPASTAAAQ